MQTIPQVRFISIHSPREGRDLFADQLQHALEVISIHSPREGRDATASMLPPCQSDFNPLAP